MVHPTSNDWASPPVDHYIAPKSPPAPPPVQTPRYPRRVHQRPDYLPWRCHTWAMWFHLLVYDQIQPRLRRCDHTLTPQRGKAVLGVSHSLQVCKSGSLPPCLIQEGHCSLLDLRVRNCFQLLELLFGDCPCIVLPLFWESSFFRQMPAELAWAQCWLKSIRVKFTQLCTHFGHWTNLNKTMGSQSWRLWSLCGQTITFVHIFWVTVQLCTLSMLLVHSCSTQLIHQGSLPDGFSRCRRWIL